MFKKLFLLIFFSFITAIFSFAKPIKVGVSDWPGWVAWYIAKEKGFFKNEGVDVDLVWFSTYSDSISALAAGQVDANSQTLSDTIPLASRGIKVKVILVNDNSNGNDAIVAKKNISSIKDLKGRKIAVEIGAIDHFFLLYVLEQHGFKEGDVNVVNMTTQDAAIALMEGKVDAVAIWEPWISKVVEGGYGHILVSSRNTPGLIPDLLVVREDSLNKNYDEYVKLAKAWFKTVDFIKKNPAEASTVISKVLNIEKADVLKMLKGIKFFGSQENILALTQMNRNHLLSLYRAGDLINDYLLKFGFIRKRVNLNNLIYERVIQDASKR